jgi:predicted Zn finger-like uncharacterized protein
MCAARLAAGTCKSIMGRDDFFRMTMRITCPRCAAIYDVPQSRLASRRIVRCARCSASWQPAPETVPAHHTAAETQLGMETSSAFAPTEAVTDVSENSPEASVPTSIAAGDTVTVDGSTLPPARQFLTHNHKIESETETLPAKTSKAAFRAGWMVPLAIILAAIFAAGYWRTDIMRAWPPSASILSVFDGPRTPSSTGNIDSERK